MVTHFQFLQPDFLWLLLGIPIIYLLLLISFKIRNQSLDILNQSRLSIQDVRYFIPHIIVLALIIIACTRPSAGYTEHSIKLQSGDYVFVLDISHSMLAKDQQPTRLAAAQRKIIDALSMLQAQQAGSRAALILYAGSAYVFCPPTSDFNAFRTFLDAVNVNLIEAKGSDLYGAMQVTFNMLSANQTNNANIIILSDFEEEAPKDQELLNLVNKHQNLHLIGFGGANGGPIPLSNGRFLRDTAGNIVISKLDTSRLTKFGKTIAKTATINDINNKDLAAIIASATPTSSAVKQKVRIYNELGPWLLVIVLIVICLTYYLRLPSIIFIALVLIEIPIANNANADDLKSGQSLFETTERNARNAYQAGNFEQSKKLYQQALEQKPNNRKILEGLAASEYRLGNAAAAKKIYEELQLGAANSRQRFEAYYNQGTSALKTSDYKAAIHALTQALQLKPDDIPTKTNLEYAKTMLENKPSPQPTPENDQNNEQKNQDQSKSENTENEPEQQQKKTQQKEQDQANADQTSEPEQEKQDSQSQDTKPEENQAEQTPTQPQQSEQAADEPDQSEQTQDNQQQEQNENNSSAEQNQAESEQKESDQKLSAQEAQAWLQSLPDSPIILRRNPGQQQSTATEQSW